MPIAHRVLNRIRPTGQCGQVCIQIVQCRIGGSGLGGQQRCAAVHEIVCIRIIAVRSKCKTRE